MEPSLENLVEVQPLVEEVINNALEPEVLEYLMTYLNVSAKYLEKIYGMLMLGFSLILGIFILCVFYKLITGFGR